MRVIENKFRLLFFLSPFSQTLFLKNIP